MTTPATPTDLSISSTREYTTSGCPLSRPTYPRPQISRPASSTLAFPISSLSPPSFRDTSRASQPTPPSSRLTLQASQLTHQHPSMSQGYTTNQGRLVPAACATTDITTSLFHLLFPCLLALSASSSFVHIPPGSQSSQRPLEALTPHRLTSNSISSPSATFHQQKREAHIKAPT